MKTPSRIALLISTALALPLGCAHSAPIALSPTTSVVNDDHGVILDTITFGDNTSEQTHAITADLSQTVTGGLGISARVLLPQTPATWQGGTLSFTMKVDPVKQNYFTARFWGSDINHNHLILIAGGKQIGWRHLGETDLLDQGTDSPAFNGRFYYTTSPIPFAITQGQTQIAFQIQSNGTIWGYGTNWAQYQKDMTDPTRGIYSVYVHTGGTFVPPSSETQGPPIVNAPVRTTPGPEVIDAVKARVNHTVTSTLNSAKPLDQQGMRFLAMAYGTKWTEAYNNPAAIAKIVAGLDNLYVAYHADPKLAQSDPAMYNAGWFGFGFAGDTIRLTASELQPLLDQQIDDGTGTKITRRAAYSKMMVDSRDWHRYNRRMYSNQTMITDLNIYRCNKAIELIDSSNALPEKDVLDYLYQAVGVKPWLGSDTPTGPSRSMGDNYWELTQQGLTKELGYVGYYGEVLDWATQIYDATRPALGEPGDPIIRTQLIKIAKARASFRYPMVDADGNRAMRIETIVGWRDEEHYPGDIAYGERTTWDASPLYTAAALLDPESVGYAQQMIADGQLFPQIVDQTKQNNSMRVTTGLLGIPDQYAAILAQPQTGKELPMTLGQPDYAFADPEDGVVGFKHGNEVFYASLYWRARNAINFLARVHDTTPTYDRIAVVHEDEQFTPSGLTYTRPDWINFGFGGGGIKYPIDMHSAHAGEQLPIAKIPDGIAFKPGDENPYAGRASFYRLRYGNYLIGMNATADKSYTLAIPPGVATPINLVTGKPVALISGSVTIPPMATVVIDVAGK